MSLFFSFIEIVLKKVKCCLVLSPINFSANESRETSHVLITDALVPVAEEEEDGDKTSNGDLDHVTPALRSEKVKTYTYSLFQVLKKGFKVYM